MKDQKIYEAIYDKYSPMVYAIAVKLSPTILDAEGVVIDSFRVIFAQKFFQKDHLSLGIKLAKIIIKSANQRFNRERDENYFDLLHLENTPILKHLLCEETGIDGYCRKYGTTKEAALRNLHQEHLQIQSISHKKAGTELK